jgi:hypothetical protein
MKNRPNRLITAFSLLAAVLCFASTAAAADEYVLLLRQSPAEGGSVSPGPGTHNFQSDTPVTLSAQPSDGYQFVYWLGDVTDASSKTTTVSVNGPKLVIAVFERTAYEFETSFGSSAASRASATRGGPAPGYNAGFGISPATGVLDNGGGFEFPDFDLPEDDDEEEIPEPATVLLIGLGIVPALVKRRHSGSK